MTFANVKIKVVKEDEIKEKTGLRLKEFTVTDDEDTLIQLTFFQALIESVFGKFGYSISNVQVLKFQDRTKLRSSDMTKINLARDANILNIEFDSDSEVDVVFDNI